MDKVDFIYLIEIIKELLNAKNQKDLAQKLALEPQAVSAAKKRNSVPDTWFEKVQVLTGKTKEDVYRLARERFSRPLARMGAHLIWGATEDGESVHTPAAGAAPSSVKIARYEELPPQVGMNTSDNKLVLLVTIPVLGTVPAGIPQDIPGVMAEYAEDYISISGVPSGSLGLRVGGDSMSKQDGTGIHKGDVVVFLPERRPTNRCIVVVNTESGGSVLRRYVEEDGKVYLDADNPEYERIEPNGGYRVVGVVIRAFRDVPLG